MQIIEVSWHNLNEHNYFLRVVKNSRMLAHIWIDNESGIAKADILNTTYLGEYRSIADAKLSIDNTLGVLTDIKELVF